jgi:pyruvate dehydrogenase E2 component (dihydrolipoamide acetyltransferase)
MNAMSITPIIMPKWGLTMEEGTILGWLVREGDILVKGQELIEIETSKITNVQECHVEGPLRRLVAQEGQTLPVGALLGVVATGDVSDNDIDAFIAGFVVETPEASDDIGPSLETTASGIAFHRKGEGSAVPVILIHGFGGDRNNWLFNVDALASDRMVVMLDLPGHGSSTKAVGAADLDMLAQAVEAVAQTSDIARAHLVGHSLGAAVAFTVAARGVLSAASLTALSGAGLGSSVNADYIAAFLSAERRKDMKAAAQQLFANPDLVTSDLVEDLLKARRIDGVPEALNALAAAALQEANQSLRDRFKGPTLLLHGAADAIIAPPADAEKIADAGHMPHLEAAAVVNAKLTAFLSAHD